MVIVLFTLVFAGDPMLLFLRCFLLPFSFTGIYALLTLPPAVAGFPFRWLFGCTRGSDLVRAH